MKFKNVIFIFLIGIFMAGCNLQPETPPLKTSIYNTNYYNDTYVNSTINQTLINGYVAKYDSGNFIGSLYTAEADSTLSDSTSLFQVVSDTRGTPAFQVQNGGPYQASFITRSFMVVNQNNTLLNSSINNDCRDWGFIHADCNTATTGADFGVTDDIEAQGLIYADEGFRGHSSEHGAYLVLGDIGKISNGSTGYYMTNNSYFCDYNANFTSGGWIIITQEDSIYNQAYADINVIINNTCVELKNNPSWNDDFGPISWIEKSTDSINMITQSGGFFEYYVGSEEKSGFKVRTKNGYGDASVMIDTDAKIEGYSALDTHIDSHGFSSTANKITMESSEIMNGGSLTMLQMVGIATNLNETDGAYIDMQFIGQPIVAGHFDGIHMPTGLNHLIEVGSADTWDKAYYEGTDITADIMAGIPTVVFDNNNDFVYVGSSENFTAVSFIVDSAASKNIKSKYFYCDSNGVWQTLAILSDTSDGFKESGSISFVNPTDRGVCNTQEDGTPFADTNDYSYIAIKRTEKKNLNAPIISFISVSGVTANMFMTESILKLNPEVVAPELCTAETLGAIYFSISNDEMCACHSDGWRKIRDGNAC